MLRDYQLGMATPLPMAPQAGTLRNSQLWETSHRKPALIILLRGEELASFSPQNRRKRKRALESHRKVNTNFLSPGSFRWSWEGPLGCLSPRLCSTMSNKTRGSGLSLWDPSLLQTLQTESSGKGQRSCKSHSPVPIKLFSLGLMVVYGQRPLILWSCCFTPLQGLCFGFDLQLTGKGKGKLKVNHPPHCWPPLSPPSNPFLSPAL